MFTNEVTTKCVRKRKVVIKILRVSFALFGRAKSHLPLFLQVSYIIACYPGYRHLNILNKKTVEFRETQNLEKEIKFKSIGKYFGINKVIYFMYKKVTNKENIQGVTRGFDENPRTNYTEGICQFSRIW